MKNMHALTLFALLLVTSLSSQASPEIYDFDWRDQRYHNKQAARIDELARDHFGSRLHQTKADLSILQRLIYKGVIAREDTEGLQAMGVVLGNVMAHDFGLAWKIYEDTQGRSRALCTEADDKPQCLFPITMLSRRIAVGIVPDVEAIYQKSYDLIADHLKKLPYQVD